MKFEVEKWDQETQNWLDLNATSGTFTLHYIEKTGDVPTRSDKLTCLIRCSLYQGDIGSPLFIRKYIVEMHEPATGEFGIAGRLESRHAKKTIVFDEKVRLAVTEHDTQHTNWYIKRWEIGDASVLYLRFTQGLTPDGYGKDDGRSIIVQALHSATPPNMTAEVIAKAVRYGTSITDIQEDVDVPFHLTVLSDQITMTEWAVESPYVGNSLSTPQLYLLTNCGNQLYKNSLADPHNLENFIVAAYMQNSFMAGGSLSGGGVQPIIVNDCDLAHLQFTLVDSNYKAIKLASPMYVTLRVEPAEDPAQDISIWKGKLPRNAPTPQEKAQMEAQQKAQQEEEARKKQQMDYLTETLSKVLANMANQQQQIEQMQAQQQPMQQQPMQPIEQEPPPPTDAELMQAERDYEFEAEQGII
jgi:hypothetical protein